MQESETSSSSSSRGSPAASQPQQRSRGNARFINSMQACASDRELDESNLQTRAPATRPFTQSCVLVGGPSTEVQLRHRISVTNYSAAPYKDAPAPPQVATATVDTNLPHSSRQRRVWSSSSSFSSSASTHTSGDNLNPDALSPADGARTVGTANQIPRVRTSPSQHDYPVAACRPTDDRSAPMHAVKSSAAVLSADAYAQVQQQLHHPRVPVRKGKSDDVPPWWSCESSVLPDDDDVTATSTAATTSSCPSAQRAAGINAFVATIMDKRGRQGAENCETFSSSSSCGCASSCACRTEKSDSDSSPAYRREHIHRAEHYERANKKCSPLRAHAAVGLVPLGTPSKSYADALRLGDSPTGTTSVDTSRGSDDASLSGSCCQDVCSSCCCRGGYMSASLCSSCEAAARTRVLHFSSAHQRDAKHTTKVSSGHRSDREASRAFLEKDVFGDAVKGGTLWAEMPPLLHLSMPTENTAQWDDATVLAQRERARLREAYMQQAALLASGTAGNTAAAEKLPSEEREGTSGPPLSSQLRSTAATQTEDGSIITDEQRQQQQRQRQEQLAREKEEAERQLRRQQREQEEEETEQRQRDARLAEERLRSIAAAQCAEVALPMLQRELEHYESRTVQQQQQQLDALLRQVHAYQQQLETQTAQHAAEMEKARVRFDEAQQRARAEEAAARQRNRRHQGTDLAEAELAPLPPTKAAEMRRTVGTQHSDGTAEKLAAVQAEATAWLLESLTSMEAELRRRLEQDEASARDLLFRVVEEPTRRVLLRCQAHVLHWQQTCVDVRQSSALQAEVRVLELMEKLARQEIAEGSRSGLRDLRDDFQRLLDNVAASAAAQASAQVNVELLAAQRELANLKQEHLDTLEHVRQLRLQLVNALRMPTITLSEHPAGAPPRLAPGAPLMAAAYAYAASTSGASAGESEAQRSTLESAGGVPQVRAEAAAQQVARALSVSEEDLPVHRRFARAHQEALRVVRAQCRSV